MLLDTGLTLVLWECLENNFKKYGKAAETKTASNPRKKKKVMETCPFFS